MGERFQKSWEIRRSKLNQALKRVHEILAEKESRLIFSKEETKQEANRKIVEVSDELLSYVSKHPDALHYVHSRKFEALIARIFSDGGFDVEMTGAGRDGGKDLIVRAESGLGNFIAYVECKRYAQDRPVGVNVVHKMNSVMSSGKVNKSIIVTTSHFTKNAEQLAHDYRFLIELRDFTDIVKWLEPYNNITI